MTSFLTSPTFWVRTAERAVKTFAQVEAAVLGATTLNVFDAPWQAATGVALGATLLSVLTSVASGGLGPSDDPSAV